MACGGQAVQSLQFVAKVGAERFDCEKTYSDIGTKKSVIAPLDFKLFIRDPKFVRKDGTTVDFVLNQDQQFQRDRVALLDFENGKGRCETGSPEMHTKLEGATVNDGDLAGFQFDVGFPENENHIDAAIAKAPLNAPGMWWSWTGGYKFMRIDVSVENSGTWFVHLGSDGCQAMAGNKYQCASSNLLPIKFDTFNAEKDAISIDLAALYANADLTTKADGMIDFVPGCMSSDTDPDCPAIFKNLGLKLKPADAVVPQSVFKVESK